MDSKIPVTGFSLLSCMYWKVSSRALVRSVVTTRTATLPPGSGHRKTTGRDTSDFLLANTHSKACLRDCTSGLFWNLTKLKEYINSTNHTGMKREWTAKAVISNGSQEHLLKLLPCATLADLPAVSWDAIANTLTIQRYNRIYVVLIPVLRPYFLLETLSGSWLCLSCPWVIKLLG